MLKMLAINPTKALFVVVLCLLFGCSGAQKTTQTTTQVNDPDTTKKSTSDTLINIVEEPEKDSLSLVYPLNLKDVYNITYLLPLYLNEYPDLNSRHEFYAQVALDYWWGAQMAFDTLKRIGLNANIKVIDTENDTAIITKFLKSNKDTTHLFFGPLFPGNLKVLNNYCSEMDVNVISPLATIDQCEDFTDRFIFSKPTISELNRASAEFLLDKYDTLYDVYIFCRAVDYEIKEAERIKSLLPKGFQKRVIIDQINKNFIDRNYLKGKLPDSAVVIIGSDRESFVTTVIAELRRSLNNYKVIGRESWLDFQSMDAEAWARLDMHFVATQNINYTDTLLNIFIKKYRKKYKAEPSKYAILGYFESVYFVLYLHSYGTNFQRFKNELDFELPHISIKLSQDDSCKFFYNNQVKILGFKNHQLVEVE